MATSIYFVGESVHLEVEEDPGQVAEAFTSAHGLPIRLTDHARQVDVYINPATVAFWSSSEAGAEPKPPQKTAQPPTGRQGVTDIWGRPLRRKPRR